MNIFLNINGEIRCINLQAGLRIQDLIEQIKEEFNIELDLSIYSSSEKLSMHSLVQENIISYNVLVDVMGGKKKKKKQFTTPKRKKHIHKNIKLRALSYFSVNKDGTVSKVKRLCESRECKGKGIFMANHKNRVYCGNCHITLVKKEETKATGKK